MKALEYKCDDLVDLFNHLFSATENTVLIGGNDEPYYLPASTSQSCHQLMFTKDYFASALHEISHWCIAGPERRLQKDFGYWYKPDCRDAHEQQAFQQAEARPQALEWLLTLATGRDFHLSLDNLQDSEASADEFGSLVREQTLELVTNGLPERAAMFRESLCDFYHQQRALPDIEYVKSYRFTL